MPSNRSNWCQTYTGKAFYLLDPVVEDIDIRDIAHALSLQCRFNGHTLKFYSISQHSVLVSQAIESDMKRRSNGADSIFAYSFWGLMHDAAEAYLGDMVSPLKRSMPEFLRAEKDMMAAICQRFGMSAEEPYEVKKYDLVLLATEARDLFATPPPHVWTSVEGMDRLEEKIVPWSPEKSEEEFLKRFQQFREKE